MSRMTWNGAAEHVWLDQTLRRERGHYGHVHFFCSADHEQDWQPYPIGPYSAICDDQTYSALSHGHTNVSRNFSSAFLDTVDVFIIL